MHVPLEPPWYVGFSHGIAIIRGNLSKNTKSRTNCRRSCDERHIRNAGLLSLVDRGLHALGVGIYRVLWSERTNIPAFSRHLKWNPFWFVLFVFCSGWSRFPICFYCNATIPETHASLNGKPNQTKTKSANLHWKIHHETEFRWNRNFDNISITLTSQVGCSCKLKNKRFYRLPCTILPVVQLCCFETTSPLCLPTERFSSIPYQCAQVFVAATLFVSLFALQFHCKMPENLNHLQQNQHFQHAILERYITRPTRRPSSSTTSSPNFVTTETTNKYKTW